MFSVLIRPFGSLPGVSAVMPERTSSVFPATHCMTECMR
jgi:hypothetical protein